MWFHYTGVLHLFGCYDIKVSARSAISHYQSLGGYNQWSITIQCGYCYGMGIVKPILGMICNFRLINFKQFFPYWANIQQRTVTFHFHCIEPLLASWVYAAQALFATVCFAAWQCSIRQLGSTVIVHTDTQGCNAEVRKTHIHKLYFIMNGIRLGQLLHHLWKRQLTKRFVPCPVGQVKYSVYLSPWPLLCAVLLDYVLINLLDVCIL